MKYNLLTAGSFYTPENATKLEKLGFSFSDARYNSTLLKYMTFGEKVTIELNTLEELMAFIEEWGTVVIDEEHSITIYDDYLE